MMVEVRAMTRDDRRDSGALTGATGSLTPDDVDEPFVPAEQRELMDPGLARGVTASVHRRAARRQAEPNAAGTLIGEEQIPPNARDGGYGSARGLAPDDPAYRMEERPETVEPPAQGPKRRRRKPSLGGDVRSDPEQEHM
jgi:hypothetical protein